MEVFPDSCTHKYLGRILTRNLCSRTEIELAHPFRVVWAKSYKHKEILIKKPISLKLRLKNLNAMISPTILFGLSSLPLTKFHLQKLNAMQRKMFR